MSKKRQVLDFKKPTLFRPSLQRSQTESQTAVSSLSLSEVADSALGSTASFSYDPVGAGLKSTQQLGLDWSKFENHTFFNSAQVKTNVAFDKIINEFPFDGTKKEIELFLETLTGFERYVYDSFPKNVGYLNFSGSSDVSPAEGSYISVVDSAGVIFPKLSKNKTGERILDPGEKKSFSMDFHLFVPSQSNDNQVVFQKVAGSNHGFSVLLSQSDSPVSCSLIFSAVSSSLFLSTSVDITKGKFHYIYTAFDRTPRARYLEIQLNNKLSVTSSRRAKIGDFGFYDKNFLIGSGTDINLDAINAQKNFLPRETFSGSIDEFRFFHKIRRRQSLERYKDANITAQTGLRLYFKFNEPSGTIGPNSTVLDSSGNSLHSLITNYTAVLRNTGSLLSPLKRERRDKNPVLFPAYVDVKTLNTALLFSASLYDIANPNLVTRLIPPHYFWEGEIFDGFSAEDGTIVEKIKGSSIPGSGEIGSAQLLSSFLFVWAKYFDELKLFTDYFSKLLTVDYDRIDTIPDQFLTFYAHYFGFDLPTFFAGASIEQYVHGENTLPDYGYSNHSLYYIQNQIWRRILTNLNDIVRSKGTVHSIKAIIRSIGINPDNNFRIREYGGPVRRSLSGLRETKTEVATLMNFSGAFAPITPSSPNSQGKADNIPVVQSRYLSGSRVEVGFPPSQAQPGNFIFANSINPTKYGIHGVSPIPADGLFTSGSFTYEGRYRFPVTVKSWPVTQSLARLHVTGTHFTGSTGNIGSHGVSCNLLVVSSSVVASRSLKLLASPTSLPDSPILEIFLTGVNIFDGNVWNVSFGRNRSDNLEIQSFQTASYFLRCARQNFGKIQEAYYTSSMFVEGPLSSNIFQVKSSEYNVSGSFIVVGSQSLQTCDMLLNSTSSNEMSRQTRFGGQLGYMRFWSKALELREWREHIINFKSLGVKDPRVNFNFYTQATGAFQRLRTDISTDQPVTKSDSSGNITLTDFSQNNIFGRGQGFELSKQVIDPYTFYYGFLSPKFDILETDNKVRVRSLNKINDFIDDTSYVEPTPVYNLVASEEPDDDTRFTIDLSTTMALDEDIMNIFSTLDFFDNAMGEMNILFSHSYPEIVQARKIYFDRLFRRINLKHFFEFFKWFDTSMGTIIAQLVPKKTNYLGINFVIESHTLERNKFIYHFDQQFRTKEELDFEAKQPRFIARICKW